MSPGLFNHNLPQAQADVEFNCLWRKAFFVIFQIKLTTDLVVKFNLFIMLRILHVNYTHLISIDWLESCGNHNYINSGWISGIFTDLTNSEHNAMDTNGIRITNLLVPLWPGIRNFRSISKLKSFYLRVNKYVLQLVCIQNSASNMMKYWCN